MTKKFSVLIVDDIPEHIAYAGRILKNSGYTVYAVTSGKDALEFLAERRPDIIMLDIKMDDMDGLEVCRRIKS
ncbi:MAG: response regulator, partial [Ruminococcus flavefaciens]|nr:response regulator [Ruminococcus flavefaciens]